MGKTRRGRALFDLLDQEQTDAAEKLKIPGWFDGHRTEREAPIRMDRERGASTRGADDEGDETAPLIEFDGGYVRLTLSSLFAAAAAFALLAVLTTVFQAGRHMGYQAGARRGFEEGRVAALADGGDEMAAARSQVPATHLIAALAPEGSSSAGAPNRASEAEPALETAGATSASGQWVRDHTYIVVQEFRPDRQQDVEPARAFLEERGIGTSPVTFDSGRIQLVTRTGFDRSDDAGRRQADELLQRVRTLGSEYYASGGGYKLEGYFKTLKEDHW